MSEETKETKTRTSITITPSLYDAAKATARLAGMSFSSFVEQCIGNALGAAPALEATPEVVAEPEAPAEA